VSEQLRSFHTATQRPDGSVAEENSEETHIERGGGKRGWKDLYHARAISRTERACMNAGRKGKTQGGKKGDLVEDRKKGLRKLIGTEAR